MFLPSVTTIKKEIDSYNNNQSWLNEISNVMIRYYRMSLRDALIFKKRIERLSNDGMVVDYNSRTPVRGNCLSLFIPIIIAMRMHDIDEARKFENGESNFLETLLDIPETKEFFSRFGENGYDKIKAIYDFSFKYENEDILRAVNVHVADIGRNLKEACLQRVGIRKI